MAKSEHFLRYASPNELRTISREDLGFYHAVIIAAVYDFGGDSFNGAESLFEPLKLCIEEHPFLSAVVRDAHGDKAYYERVPTISLENHVTLLPKLAENAIATTEIEEVLGKELDRPFTSGIPPWRVVLLPLQPSELLVAFSFSHTIGDGASGQAFHKSLLKAVRGLPSGARPISGIVTPPKLPLGAPFDTPERLPISWGFLLGPLLGAILPRFLANLLGLEAAASAANEGTFRGVPAAFDPATHRTGIKLRELPAPVLASALRATRAHDAKITGVLQELIVRALSKALPATPSSANFVSQTAINMRSSVGVPADEMGEFASGCYVHHPRPADPDAPLVERDWAAARETTRRLAETATTLQDQPIGLLRYAPSVRGWTAGKIGQPRDSSFEMSNVGVFDASDEAGGARMVKMIFAQPGHVISSPIAFNVVSVKGGSLVYTVTWPSGALGLPAEEEEGFVERVCESLDADIKAL